MTEKLSNRCSLQQGIEDFIVYMMRIRNMSACTSKAYEFNLTRFSEWTQGEGIDVYSMSPSDVMDFIGFLRDYGLSERSCNQNLSSIRTFLDFMRRFKGLEYNPAASVQFMKTNKPLPRYLTEKQVDEIVAKCSQPSSFKGLRSRAILLTFVHTGIRCAELENLKMNDVNLDADYLKVTGKGDKQRIIPFGVELHNCLRQWVSMRNIFMQGRDCDAFFITSSFTPLSSPQIRIIVKDILKDIVPMKLAHPHVLRHTFATLLMNNGARLECIQKLMGHRSIETTASYEHVTYAKMKEDYDKAMGVIRFKSNVASS